MKKTTTILLLVALSLLAVTMLSAVPKPDSPEYDAWKRNQIGSATLNTSANPTVAASKPNSDRFDVAPLLIPLDGTFALAMEPNDDGSSLELLLPFTFSLYGESYTSCWINNNGNVTFDGALSSYTPWAFPSGENPMLAPFFADVDTRGDGVISGGTVSYKIEANRMIVIWDHVGYYGAHADKLNTFELIFTDGTDTTIGLGNNVAFSYDDMSWTTGDASSGIGGFGGSAATVGNNKGDNVEYSQIGRFDHAGIDYDGPYDNNDGVDWLDGQLFLFNTGTTATLTIIPSTYGESLSGIDPPAGSDPQDPYTFVYYADYPLAGNLDVQYPVGAGSWRGWIYYGSAWHQADVYPVVGPGTVVFSNVPFGAKFVVPFLITTDPPTLPVELSSFTAILTAQSFVKLTWVSESETDMRGYNIYRNQSADYAAATHMGFQEPTNSSNQHIYSYTDNEVAVDNTYYYWLECVENNGTSTLYGPQYVTVNGTEAPDMHNTTALGSAYPNPFKANTTFSVDVKDGENATVTIYNIAGQAIKSFNRSSGTHTINWDGRDAQNNLCGSGIYFYRLTSPTMNQTRKMMIVK